jgi:nucleoside-diphosphate-sugar epimerase
MARILITGANGFTGLHMLRRLARDGHELHGIVRGGATDCLPMLATCHEADLCDYAPLAKVVADVRPQKVVHLAAIAFVPHSDAARLYATTILGTRNLLQALANADERPSAVLIASSANVYGNRRNGILSEELAPAPANDYGVTKAACEMLAQIYADRLPVVTVRPFNYTGVGQSEDFIIPKIVAHARGRRPVIELGNIDVARDYSDARTVVDCYARLLDAPAAMGGVFNVCSGQARSLAEILAMVEAQSGHQMAVRINSALARADEIRSLCGSRARLESVIGPVTMPPLSETIAWMLNG